MELLQKRYEIFLQSQISVLPLLSSNNILSFSIKAPLHGAFIVYANKCTNNFCTKKIIFLQSLFIVELLGVNKITSPSL